MDKGWEVSEDQYLEHLMTNHLYNVEQQQLRISCLSQNESRLAICTQTFCEQTPKGRSRLRFRTTSMPKLIDDSPSPKKIIKKILQNNESKSPIKSPLKTPIRLPQKMHQAIPRMSLKSTVFQNPIEEGIIKMGRTLQPKQFNPLATLKLANEPQFPGMKGQTRSVKSASMSNIFNDERIQNKKKIEDFVFKLKPQRNANVIYMNVALRPDGNDDAVMRRFQKQQ